MAGWVPIRCPAMLPGGGASPLLPEALLQRHRVTGAALIRTVIDGVNLSVLQAALERLDLWREAALLERLLYKNRSQHRGSLHFRRLEEVQRWLRIMRTLRLPELLLLLHSLTQAPALGTAPKLGGKARPTAPAAAHSSAWLPTRGAVLTAMARLRGSCRAVAALIPALRKAAAALLGQLARSYFMPFCLTAAAVLARIQVLAAQMLLDSVRSYNALAELAPLCPTFSAGEDLLAAELPESLAAEWIAGAPSLHPIVFSAGKSFISKAAGLMERYGMWVAVPQGPIASSAAVGWLTPAGPVVGVSSLGQPLDREAYRNSQASGNERTVGPFDGASAFIAAAATLQRSPHPAGRAGPTGGPEPQPDCRQRPQPRARASEPLLVFRDARGGTAEEEPVAAPLYERAPVALGMRRSNAEMLPPVPSLTRQAPGRGIPRHGKHASFEMRATGATPSDALDRPSGMAAAPGGAALRIALLPSKIQTGAVSVIGVPTTAATLTADGAGLSREGVPESQPAHSPAAAVSKDAGSSSTSQLGLSDTATAYFGAVVSPEAGAADAATGQCGNAGPLPVSALLSAGITKQHSKFLQQPLFSATEQASRPQSGGSSGIAAGRQASITLDGMMGRKKKRSRTAGSATPCGGATLPPSREEHSDWADLLSPTLQQPQAAQQPFSGAPPNQPSFRGNATSGGAGFMLNSQAGRTLGASRLEASHSQQQGPPTQLKQTMADIFSMLLNTE